MTRSIQSVTRAAAGLMLLSVGLAVGCGGGAPQLSGQVGQAAIAALPDPLADAEATVALLSTAALIDGDDSVRYQAVEAVGEIGGEPAIRVLEEALLDQDHDIREAAISALADIGDDASATALATVLDDEDALLRDAVVHALARIGGPTAIALLQRASMDVDESVRRAADDALAELETGDGDGPLTELKNAIAARLLLMDDVARYKWSHELPIVDREREAALLERATADAVAAGLPETYARRVLGAQIEASRALQLELVAAWQRDQHPPFTDVPDLTAVQRPLIDAATRQLLENLAVSLCALARSAERAEFATAPVSLTDRPAAWATATAALWPVPDSACSGP